MFKKVLASTAFVVTYLSLANSQALAQTASPGSSVNPDLKFLPTGFADNITILITSLLSVAIALVALLVFFYLIWGGIDWITSGGDKSKTEQARGKIMAAIIGLIIVAASYAIIQLLVRFLGYPSLTAVFEGIVPITGGATAPFSSDNTTPLGNLNQGNPNSESSKGGNSL